MPITLDEFKALSPEEQQTVLREMCQQNIGRIRASFEEVFDRYDLQSKLVPKIPFRPAPRTQTVNLDPPPMSDEAVRERFRNDPNLRELVVSGVKYERI